jgi:hypothetical protein
MSKIVIFDALAKSSNRSGKLVPEEYWVLYSWQVPLIDVRISSADACQLDAEKKSSSRKRVRYRKSRDLYRSRLGHDSGPGCLIHE